MCGGDSGVRNEENEDELTALELLTQAGQNRNNNRSNQSLRENNSRPNNPVVTEIDKDLILQRLFFIKIFFFLNI